MASQHLIFLLLLIIGTNNHGAHADENHYCGANWMAAQQSCTDPCPNNLASECPPGLTCHGFTGCADKLSKPKNPPPVETPQNLQPTAKPTRRTKRPTSKPTTGEPTVSAEPTPVPPTASPAGTPTASPFVRPLLEGVTTINGDLNGENTILSTTSQRSYGMIFEVETTEDSPAISIQNLEFYSPLQGANVAYEVWTKKGTWHGFEGQDRKFRKVIHGNVTTSMNPGGMTRLPSRMTIRIDGGGKRQSIYLTLSTKHMLYAHSTEADENFESVTSIEEVNKATKDTIILTETPELIVYEGAAVMIHPFEKASQRIFYRMPRGFVGKIWYHRNPCLGVPIKVTNETTGKSRTELQVQKKWEECVEVAKLLEPIPEGPMQIPEWILNGEDERDDGGNSNNTFAASFNGTAPTASPTISLAPTIYAMKVNLIMTLQNVAENRILTLAEQRAFEKITVEFYEVQDLLDLNEVEIYGGTIHYQQIFVENGNELNQRKRRRRRQLQIAGPETPEGIVISSQNNDNGNWQPEEDWIRSVILLEVTLVISILYSPLPQQITQELLQTLLINNEIQLVRLLQGEPALAGYFGTLGGIPSVLAVDRLTDPPTRRPTDSPTPEVSEEIEEVIQLSTPMVVAIVAGIIYTFLAIASMCYVKRARRKMKIAKQMGKSGVGGIVADSATSHVNHGMQFEGGNSKKAKKDDDSSFYDDGGDYHNGNDSSVRKSARRGSRGLFGKRSIRKSFNKKKVNDSQTSKNKSVNQYDQQMKFDEENEIERYQSEEGSEVLSSMEDSYYSEDEEEGSYDTEDEDEEGSSYSEEEE